MSSLPQLNKNRAGETDTNPAGPEAIQVTIRRIAATQAVPSDGNKESVKTPPAAPSNEKRVGNVDSPSKPPADHNKTAREATPPYAKESLAGDGWGRAANAARKLHRAR